MTNSNLKPCPFCGQEVTVTPEGDYIEILCDDCHLAIWHESEDAMVSTWNQRRGHVNDLLELRLLVWGKDIPHPTGPEYVEHHESIQQILAAIDKLVDEAEHGA